jgi:hypothetical protein
MRKDWEYYNHALVPTTPPHVDPDTSWMKDRKMWKELAGGKYPLFARWTTEFDCKYETNWWYIIREAPFEFEKLGKHAKKHIRQALRKCIVKKVCANECTEELFQVYEEAYQRYKNADNQISYDQFKKGIQDEETVEYWAGYDLNDRMIGYLAVIENGSCMEISVAKFSPQYMNLRVSDALYYTVLEYYLNKLGKKYVSSGQRSINHLTNTQEYKIETFGFHKAYCRMHIKYNFGVGWVIRLLYPFRNLFRILEKVTVVHQLLGVLKMEEIYRTFHN